MARAEVLFEGYSVIRSGSSQIGYTVQRYEFDAQKKQFSSIYYLKTNEEGGNIEESLKAYANDKFQPVKYQYTSKTGNSVKTIDVQFKGLRMTGTLFDGKATQTINRSLPKGTFLSTFLGYLMLQNGYKVNKKFKYSAVAEEDAQAYTGEAYIKSEDDIEGEKVYRIENTFKSANFVSLVTPKGEVLGTTSPLQSINTELKATAAEATTGFVIPNETLKLLFNSVPTGRANVLALKRSSSKTDTLKRIESPPKDTPKISVPIKPPPKGQ